MKGILYAVGVGPGDPDMLTMKAVKTINMADVIACPAKDSEPGVAYQIAKQACPCVSEKETQARHQAHADMQRSPLLSEFYLLNYHILHNNLA